MARTELEASIEEFKEENSNYKRLKAERKQEQTFFFKLIKSEVIGVSDQMEEMMKIIQE